MDLSSITKENVRFESHKIRLNRLLKSANKVSPPVHFETIGFSEQKEPITGIIIGNGPSKISLLAGSHADEPVGPETLHVFIESVLSHPTQFKEILEQFTFFIIPHINPDGENKNWKWITLFPDLHALIKHRYRELPGRDIEFGYPDMRPENYAASSWWKKHAPFDMHINLHGMSFSEGALLLIDRHSVNQTSDIRDEFQKYITSTGFGFHDHDRNGEKGFRKITKGISTTPESDKMKELFLKNGDQATASEFKKNSMEFLREFNKSLVSIVTEFPLYKLPSTAEESPGIPKNYITWQKLNPKLQHLIATGKATDGLISKVQFQHVPLKQNIMMQLKVIQLGLQHATSCQKS